MENWSGEWASRQKKDNTERATGLGRRTREEIVKWNQMTALGLGDLRVPRPPFGKTRPTRVACTQTGPSSSKTVIAVACSFLALHAISSF